MPLTYTTQVKTTRTAPEDLKTDLLVLAWPADADQLPASLKKLDTALAGALARLLELGDFDPKPNATAVLYPSPARNIHRALLVGLGDLDKLTTEALRQAAGTATRQARKLAAARVALALHPDLATKLDPESAAQAIAEGAISGGYDFREFLSDDNRKTPARITLTIAEPDPHRARKLAAGARIGTILANAANAARHVDNLPGNVINPPSLAAHARKLARQAGIHCRVYTDQQLTRMKMNALLAVGSGSASKPRLIELEYNGRSGQRRTAPPDAIIVGKAITFDSGGISIKPSANMKNMVFDKSGGCSVLGILTGAAALKLNRRIIGLIPAAENLPSHTAYRPGDIIRTYSGKTVEIDNTDAEGRLILCDALAYAARMKPKAILDLATLTGACAVALGAHHAGLFTNDPKLLDQVRAAAERSGEKCWNLPSGPEYLEQMKSKVADLKNSGGREGGACTAAAFLSQFVNNTPWAHVDIAAVADSDKETPYRATGATGFGVRLMLEFLRNL